MEAFETQEKEYMEREQELREKLKQKDVERQDVVSEMNQILMVVDSSL